MTHEAIVPTTQSITLPVGSDALFKCTPTIQEPVDWILEKPLGSKSSPVVSAGQLVVYPHQRYRLYTNSNGSYNLLIYNLQLSDTGWYVCVEESGAGTRQQPVFLNVSEGNHEYFFAVYVFRSLLWYIW